jgi:hypothetical protein
MLVRRLITRVAFVFVLTTLAIPAHADNTWSVYHWARTTISFDLITVDSMTSEWQPAFDGTVSRWSASDSLNLVGDQGDESRKFRRRCKPKEGQIVACNLSYGGTGWLGLAGININSAGHIVKGYAKMNDFYSSYWALEGERNHVTCQEVGHLLGLDHQSEDFDLSLGTCMDYSSDPASQWPNGHDYDTLLAMYAHLDSTNSYDDPIVEGTDNGCNAPPGKGCNKAGIGADAPMGIPVHIGLNHEIWVASDNAGGYWIHHIRTVPEKYRNN